MLLKYALSLCICLTLAGTYSCRARSKETAQNPVPQLVKGGDNGSVFTVDSSAKGFSLAGKNQTIEIDLSIDQPKSMNDGEQAPLPKCAQRFAPETEVGQLSCTAEDVKEKVTLRAKHVRQVCSAGHENTGTLEASAKQPVIEGCKKTKVQMYQFLPEVEVRLVEQK